MYNRSHYPVGHGHPILPPDRTFFHPTSGYRVSAKLNFRFTEFSEVRQESFNRELKVDRIKLTVKALRAHVSVLAELASLVNLQVGADARLEEVELEIEGVRAKLLFLKVDLDNIRAILKHALETVAEHPEILSPDYSRSRVLLMNKGHSILSVSS